MSRRTWALVVGAVSAASAAGAAHAAPPWEAPRTVARPPSGPPAIDFGSGGTALLSWNEGVPGEPNAHAHFATLRAAGGVADAGRVPGALAARPVVYGRDRVVVMRMRPVQRRAGTYRLDASSGTTREPVGARWRRIATIPADVGQGPGPDLEVNDRGDAAVVWIEVRRPRNRPEVISVRVVVARRGRAFGRPVTLATGSLPTLDSQAVAAAYAATGDLVVAYSTTRREGRRDRPVVAARVRRAGSASFGRAQVLGPRQPLTDLTAATAPDGRMVVAWGSQDSGEGAERPWVVRAAVRPAGRGRFGWSQLLDPGETRDRVPGRVALDMGRDGRATVAWSNVRGRAFPLTYPVRMASTGPTGGFGPVTQLADNGAAGDVALAPDGTALVAWTSFDPEADPDPAVLYARVRPATAAAFGPPEQIASPAGGGDVAYNPLTGRPTAVWSQFTTGEVLLAGRTG